MPGDDGGMVKAPTDPAAIRAEIERTRAQIQASVVDLRHEVATATDWREWVRDRPGLCLGAAFALGFYLGNRR